MQIDKIPVAKLKAAEYNPRRALKPGDAEYEKLKRSITEFGYVEPVIWNKQTGNVVGGHQRLTVIRNLYPASHGIQHSCWKLSENSATSVSRWYLRMKTSTHSSRQAKSS